MAANISDKDVLANNTNLSGTQSWFYRNVSVIHVSTEFPYDFVYFSAFVSCTQYAQ